MSRNLLGKTVTVTIDRPIGSRHPEYGYVYPINYGYIAGVFSGDGEETDAYVLGENEPLTEFCGTVIAVIHRLNDDDDKLIVTDGRSFSDEQIRALTDFQERWFRSEILR